jgi:heterodisulfide reductase subunit B2
MDIAYYPGCSLKASHRLYDDQCTRIFREFGVNLRELDDWNCCGSTSAGKTNDFLAVALPARNLGLAEATGLQELMIPCSACYSRTLVAQVKLDADPNLKREINAELKNPVRGGIKVRTILELMLPWAKSGALKKRVKKPLAGLKPACYYGCMLTRFPHDVPVSDDVENPQGMETILRALGAEPVDWSYKTDCCGAGAAVNDQETAFALMARIMKDAVGRGANCFVTTCPMCQMNLDLSQESYCGQHGICERLPVYFITEMVGVALGISPGELQVDKHFQESVALLDRVLNV